MKTKLSFLILSFIVFHFNVSCLGSKESTMDLKTSFCENPCAITNKCEYNTETGTASWEVIIPDGGKLSAKSQSGNTITYTCTGGNGNTSKVTLKQDTAKGLSKNPQSKLIIIVTYEACDTEELLTKKKTSVVQGSPFNNPTCY
ncbi:hypothetical protein ACFSSB_02125 [Lacinutrix gracilariae]|uniref:Ig-like domain-containing protein n=1 Tax=Lacinutrix gracilariae TaxID=1747198 RepID=A0ABW5JWI8_9FLAO